MLSEPDLLATAGTLVATVWLYIVIPKDMPLQDTGFIYAVMEGGEEVSFADAAAAQ